MTTNPAPTMATAPDIPCPSNPGADNVPYYTPRQSYAPGTALSPSVAELPLLFRPLKLRGVTMPHRIAVSPMCMYSCRDGHLTDFHVAHYGSFALHGAGLAFVEATAVQPNGRITPQCAGLWQDSQIDGLRRVVDLYHGLGQLVGIQLAHAGRKASTVAPWVLLPQAPGSWKPADAIAADVKSLRTSAVVPANDGGWPDNVVAPSKLTFGPGFAEPRELTESEISQLISDWVASAKRAVKAGVDMIEIHGAHGYLMTEFLSSLTNKRTDKYGGSFENRTRLLKEVIVAVRKVIPDTMPLWLRISATEWADGGWTIEDTISLAKDLPSLGIDVLDISSGGNVAHMKIPVTDRQFQTRLAGQVRQAVREAGLHLPIAAVGLITSAETALELTQQDDEGNSTADIVLAARQFLREPEWVQRVAHQLGVEAKWVEQYHRAVWKKTTEIR